jgi:hypothetical protein
MTFDVKHVNVSFDGDVTIIGPTRSGRIRLNVTDVQLNRSADVFLNYVQLTELICSLVKARNDVRAEQEGKE